jgi:8-oxo-dGTP pyrophosphatase MutT (NUDIX family)
MTCAAKIATCKGIATSCGTLVINDAGQILLCHVTGMNHWDIPKGMQEPDELPLKAAQRELHEETGLAFDDGMFAELGSYDYQKNKRLHLFKVNVPSGRVTLSDLRCTSYFAHRITGRPTPEMDGFRWARREELRALCTLPMAERLLSIEW